MHHKLPRQISVKIRAISVQESTPTTRLRSLNGKRFLSREGCEVYFSMSEALKHFLSREKSKLAYFSEALKCLQSKRH